MQTLYTFTNEKHNKLEVIKKKQLLVNAMHERSLHII